MSNPTHIKNLSNIAALSQSLSAIVPDTQVCTAIKALGAARLASFMPRHDLKDAADDCHSKLSEYITRITDHVNTHTTSNSLSTATNNQSAISTPAINAKMALNELNALKYERPKHFSDPDIQNINSLLEATTSHSRHIGTIHQTHAHRFFDVETVDRLDEAVSFIKGADSDVGNIQVADWFVASNKRLTSDIKVFSPQAVSDSLVNLMAHQTYQKVHLNMVQSPEYTAMMFETLGQPCDDILYQHADSQKNPAYAKSLIQNRQFGMLSSNDTIKKTDQAKLNNLIALIAMQDDGADDISHIIKNCQSDKVRSYLLDSIVDAHNQQYHHDSLDKIFDKSKDYLTLMQIKQLATKLSRNFHQQPIIKPLDRLASIASAKGYDDQDIHQLSKEIKDKLASELSAINDPITHYTNVYVSNGNDKEVWLRDCVSAAHFLYMISGDDDYHFNGIQSELDHMVVDNLNISLDNDNQKKLNSLFSDSIKSLDYSDNLQRAQVLFEANKHNKILPKIDHSNYLTLPRAVGDKVWLRRPNDLTKLDLLANIRHSQDFINLARKNDITAVVVDHIGADEDLNKKVSYTLNEVLKNTDSMSSQKALDNLLGLPVTLLSSKITNSKELPKESQELARKGSNRLTDKIASTVKGAIHTANTIRRP